MFEKTLPKLLIAAGILAALVILPIPLLPPQILVESVQSYLRLGGQAAYLLCAVFVQSAIYFVIGLSATFMFNRAHTLSGRLLQAVALPLVVVSLALIVRSLRAGQVPAWVNAVVPIAACLCGVYLGLSVLNRHWKIIACILIFASGTAVWTILANGSPQLRAAITRDLEQIVAAGPDLPSGDARFGALIKTAFAASNTLSAGLTPIDQNRAAIIAVGIADGHPNIARLVGLKTDSMLVQNAVTIGQGSTLDGRADWPRHYAVSAALAVLGYPLVSDAGGLMKEQLDTLTRGSGFSFGDLAADRAGVRFASAATRTDTAARTMQERLLTGIPKEDLFPVEVHFPENLSVEEVRSNFGRVGSERYKSIVSDIEASLDRCSALASN